MLVKPTKRFAPFVRKANQVGRREEKGVSLFFAFSWSVCVIDTLLVLPLPHKWPTRVKTTWANK